MPKTPQEIMRDFILRRSHYMYRVENKAMRELMLPYGAAKREITDRMLTLQKRFDALDPILMRNPAMTEWRLQRMRDQLAEIKASLDMAAIEGSRGLGKTINQVAMVDADAYQKMLQGQFGKIGIDITRLPYSHIDYIMSNPLYGQNIGEKMILWNDTTIIKKMNTELTQAIVQGEDMRKATNRLVGLGDKIGGEIGKTIAFRAGMIARSEIQYVSNQVTRAIYLENQDILKGVQFLATLDNRTCMVCASKDGKNFYYKEGQDHNGPILPLHPSCRCTYMPITKSWKELGSKVPEHISKNTRLPFTGRPTDRITYDKWFRGLKKSEQIDILGAKKWVLFNKGDLKLTQMVKSNKELSAKAIEIAMEKAAKKGITKKVVQIPKKDIKKIKTDGKLGAMSDSRVKKFVEPCY